MKEKQTTKIWLSPEDQEALTDHVITCVTEKNKDAVEKAIIWMRQALEVVQVSILQISGGETPALILSIESARHSDGIAESHPPYASNITPRSLIPLMKSPSSRWWKAAKPPGPESIGHGSAEGKSLHEFIYLPPPCQKSAKTNSAVICSVLTESHQLDDTDKYVISALAPAIRTALVECLHARGSPLSDRELEVLKWSAMGKTAWEIGQLISISEPTVKFHFSNIYKKLQVTSRAQALSHAISHGWI
ncbi:MULTISPECIES: response regulator transcription factor [Pseudomonas]|jgi:DNA-binding CsgD family transcriptional regulator|uniref:response regulator transcription factor n=1 Tax=Pseudomonas TaxID=286 RepID=UPI0002A45B1C|nr:MULTISPECIES: helix-turn-helix transcriptional regulator [Pseudomonas]UNY92014.1 helix-turn-helix transcriptional regulator [Pseudomonas sp. M1]GLU36676.1 LuxR family transcriptional regulator [Pseudomonas sp. NBRC 100443]